MENCRFPNHPTKDNLPNSYTTTSQDLGVGASALHLQQGITLLTMLCQISSLLAPGSHSSQHLSSPQHADHHVVQQQSSDGRESITLSSRRKTIVQRATEENTE